MSDIRVDLKGVQVTKGQGASEGALELRVGVQEGAHRITWPSLNGSVPVDSNGAMKGIGDRIASYRVTSGTLSKTFTIDVTEVDKGLNGQDDEGHGSVTFDLTPNMAPVTKYALVNLKRPKGGWEGQVKVELLAQVA